MCINFTGSQQTTGTQSDQAAGARLNDEQMQRIHQEMSAGIQSVLGQVRFINGAQLSCLYMSKFVLKIMPET